MLQCCLGSLATEGATQSFWNLGVHALYHRLHHNRASCPCRARNFKPIASLGHGPSTRYPFLLRTLFYLFISFPSFYLILSFFSSAALQSTAVHLSSLHDLIWWKRYALWVRAGVVLWNTNGAQCSDSQVGTRSQGAIHLQICGTLLNLG